MWQSPVTQHKHIHDMINNKVHLCFTGFLPAWIFFVFVFCFVQWTMRSHSSVHPHAVLRLLCKSSLHSLSRLWYPEHPRRWLCRLLNPQRLSGCSRERHRLFDRQWSPGKISFTQSLLCAHIFILYWALHYAKFTSAFCVSQALGSSLHGDSIWKQPGPVEALKQTLFRLQAVEAQLGRQKEAPGAPTLSDRLCMEETLGNQDVSVFGKITVCVCDQTKIVHTPFLNTSGFSCVFRNKPYHNFLFPVCVAEAWRWSRAARFFWWSISTEVTLSTSHVWFLKSWLTLELL